MSRLFGVSYPVVQAGMIWVSGWRLANAVAQAGGLGVLGAGSMRPDVLRHHIHRLRAAWDGPFAVNMPLLYHHMPACLEVITEENVPIVISSAGSPAGVAKALAAADVVHVHVVAAVRQALKCQDLGLAAVVCEGYEAGGHNAPQGTTSLCLIPQVVDALEIPVIAAGGIADGRGMAAALALGAEGVQVGTRFAATQESSAHPAYKAAVVEAGDRDTVVALQALTPVRLIKNAFSQQALEAEAQGASPAELKALLGQGRGRRGIFEGDLEAGEIEAGQIAGMIADLPPAEEVMQRLVREYQGARSRLP